MANYAVQADYDMNKSKDPTLQLYNPNTTTLQKGDNFLGSSAAIGAPTDQALQNAGVNRIYGSDRYQTASAFDNYLKAQQAPKVTDNSALIQQMYDQQLASAQAALRQSIQRNMGQYQNTIQNAPQQYQPLRDQASATGYKNLNSLREMLANNGQQGGVNRTDETAVNTETQNNINALNLQQQNVINTAQKAITDLQASGNLQEAQLVAQNASEKLRALIDESNRVQSTGYQYSQDAIKNAMNEAQLTGTYNGQQTLAAQNAQNSQALNLAQLMGIYNGQPTLAAKDAQQQQALNLAQLLGVYDGQPTLSARQLQQSADQFNSDQAYKYAALAASQMKSSSPSVSQQQYNDKQTSTQNTSRAMDYLNKWASGQALDDNGQNLGRATRNDILSWVSQHAGELNSQGVDVNKLQSWADQTFQWNP